MPSFTTGTVTEVLLTRRDSLEAEMELIERRKREFEAMVGVYQSLGGGWR